MTAAVRQVLKAYGDGIYAGDVALLARVFDPRARLFGEVRGEPYFRDLAQYLDLVAHRQSPSELGEPYGFEILSVEVSGAIALARMRCRMLGHDYRDYLSLVCNDGCWRIVSKVFTDLAVRTVDS